MSAARFSVTPRESRELLWAAVVLMALAGGVRAPRGLSSDMPSASGGCGAGGAAAGMGAAGVGAAALKGAGSVAVKGASSIAVKGAAVGIAAHEAGVLATASRGAMSAAGEAAVAKGASATLAGDLVAGRGSIQAVSDVGAIGVGHGAGQVAEDGARAAAQLPRAPGIATSNAAVRVSGVAVNASRARLHGVGARALSARVSLERYPALSARYPRAAALQRTDPARFYRVAAQNPDLLIDLGTAVCDDRDEELCP